MIDYLSYCRVLRIERMDLSTEKRMGSVRTVTTGQVALARIRELHAEVKFFYKDHEMHQSGAWVCLKSAVESAQGWSTNLGLGPDSEGEVRIELRVTDMSVSLVRPERYDSSIRYVHTQELQTSIETQPGQEAVDVLNEVIWSSKRSAGKNAYEVERALAVFEDGGRNPQNCREDVEALFKQMEPR